MLTLLLSWMLIIVISIPFGVMTLKSLSFLRRKELSIAKVDLDLILLLGFSIVTILASYLSLFIPVNIYLTSFLLVIALGTILLNKKEYRLMFTKLIEGWKELSTSLKIITGILIIGILVVAASPITHYDFGLFQLQYLKWIQEFSVVPGLGNLDHRFSFNSHYFIASALFSVIISEEQVICSLNNFFYAVLVIRLIYHIKQAYSKQSLMLLIFHLLLLGLFIYFMLSALNGLSTDILNNLLVCFTLLFLIQLNTNKDKKEAIYWTLPFIVCLTITFKLSSALLIITLLFLLYQVKTWQYFFYLGACGLLICIPFLSRNIILSGYLIFPFPPIDIFSVDWKVPMEVVVGEIANVKGWARVPYTKELSLIHI